MYLQLTLLSLTVLISLILLIKLFSGKVILEINAEYATHNLKIEKSGFYSLWIFGKLFTKPTLERFNAKIIDENQDKVFEIPSFFRPNSNNGSSGTIQLKYFYLKKGNYKFEIEDNSENSLNILDKTIGEISFSKKSDDFGYKIKKTLPEFLFPIFLIGILIPIMKIVKILTEK
jgi:hypothetical protein